MVSVGTAIKIGNFLSGDSAEGFTRCKIGPRIHLVASEGDSPRQNPSGRGLPHSMTLRVVSEVLEVRQFWSAPVLWRCSSGSPQNLRLRSEMNNSAPSW